MGARSWPVAWLFAATLGGCAPSSPCVESLGRGAVVSVTLTEAYVPGAMRSKFDPRWAAADRTFGSCGAAELRAGSEITFRGLDDRQVSGGTCWFDRAEAVASSGLAFEGASHVVDAGENDTYFAAFQTVRIGDCVGRWNVSVRAPEGRDPFGPAVEGALPPVVLRRYFRTETPAACRSAGFQVSDGAPTCVDVWAAVLARR